MIITRKIEIFICEEDKELRKAYYEKIYDTIHNGVKVANFTASQLFMMDNSIPYLSQEDRDKLTFLGCKGQKATRQNAPYVAASNVFKDKVSMRMIAPIQQPVRKYYEADKKEGIWNKSLRSYKSNMPIPFPSSSFINLRFASFINKESQEKQGFFFTLIGIPFQMKFGRDRSNNKAIVKDTIEGKYKLCTSSIKSEKNKLFLLFCVEIPEKEIEFISGKKMFAFLGVMNPIVCTCDVRAKQSYDSGMKCFEIGTKEEFNYRRRQIQEALKRNQIEAKYNKGGKGRKRKCQSIDRFHKKEKNYVDTKLHTYSRMLIDLAIKHKCEEIVLMKQISREEKAKEENENKEPFVLRNWSYYGLKEKIAYKAKMVGIKLSIEK